MQSTLNISPGKGRNQDYKVELFIDGAIGYDIDLNFDDNGELKLVEGNTVSRLRKLVKDAGKGDKVLIHLNSLGGVAWQGMAMYNYIRQHPAEFHVNIYGMCASAATDIMCAADRVTAAPSSQIMTHQASVGVYGNVKNLEDSTKLLRQINRLTAEAYAYKTGLSVDDAEELFLGDGDNWLTAKEALEYGFVDAITPDDVQMNAMMQFAQMSFERAGLTSNIQMSALPPTNTPISQPTNSNMEPILKQLGLRADATEEQQAEALASYTNKAIEGAIAQAKAETRKATANEIFSALANAGSVRVPEVHQKAFDLLMAAGELKDAMSYTVPVNDPNDGKPHADTKLPSRGIQQPTAVEGDPRKAPQTITKAGFAEMTLAERADLKSSDPEAYAAAYRAHFGYDYQAPKTTKN